MGDKGTLFYTKKTLNPGGSLFTLQQPIVQGILNITPDSFFDKSRSQSLEGTLLRAEKMIKDGASILDIGGQSTRPNAEIVNEATELDRVIPIISALSEKFPDIVLSIDTFRSEVARKAIAAGAHIINDVSGGELDPNMFETVADLNVPYILMHSRGDSQTMMQQTRYQHLITDIAAYFESKINILNNLGVQDIIIDPGFGFAKTLDQNYYLLQNLEYFKCFERPILAGLSRKSMIHRFLDTDAENALAGTIVLNTFALQNGASILRVHDVKEARETIQLYQKVTNVQI